MIREKSGLAVMLLKIVVELARVAPSDMSGKLFLALAHYLAPVTTTTPSLAGIASTNIPGIIKLIPLLLYGTVTCSQYSNQLLGVE